MTIFLFELTVGTALIAAATDTATAQQPDTICSNIATAVERACIGRRIEGKEHQLKTIYQRAETAVRRNFANHGREDNRSNPAYLQKSQAAWRRFVDNDCKMQAAFGGGSNLSISDREIDCREAALDKRIEFLGELADGSFGTG